MKGPITVGKRVTVIDRSGKSVTGTVISRQGERYTLWLDNNRGILRC